MRGLIWAGLVMFLVGCNSGKVEELTRQNQTLQTQLDTLLVQNKRLQDDFARLKRDFGKIETLSQKLSGVSAKIMTTMGEIDVELYPDKAPLHCLSFIARAESGFYNNTQFHRVIPGFMIQGGDPNSRDDNPDDDGRGGPSVMIPHEFNDIRHERGVLSTARVGDPRVGAGSQFFIMHGDNFNLDRQYTVFGRVTKGMEVVDEIATTPTYKNKRPAQADHPIKPVRIRRIEIVTPTASR
ncbi:MAG TPA: peptidylprolyl isomerase [Calditrichia bacterium]|nr:peptidylprolyl isomerase [Calditrichota bacterium]HQV33037.1 peptidylprolyl isomerase [Calditrichia bacterium]